MSYKFGVGKYRTRDGREAVVVSDEMPGQQPLCGWIVDCVGDANACCWGADGGYMIRGLECSSDLMQPERWAYKDSWNKSYEVSCDGEYRYWITGDCDIQHLINLLNAAERDQ